MHTYMSGDSGIERAPRARPVADAPVDALLAQADELARRWAIELILARPLAQMAEVPLEDLAREAPGLCAQVVRALESDAELQRLVAGEEPRSGEGSTPAPRLAALARARDASACAEQVEALRGVLWEAILSELRWPISDRSPVRLVVDLSDRLAFVCAAVLAATLEQSPTANLSGAPRAAPAAGREQVLYSSPRALAGRRGAVLVDEREEALPRPGHVGGRSQGAERPAAPAVEPAGLSDGSTTEQAELRPARESPCTGRPLPWDTPLRAEHPEGRTSPAGGAQTMPSGHGSAGAQDSGDPVMRITRRPVSPIDERP